MSRIQIFTIIAILLFAQGCTTYNEATGRNEFIFVSTEQEVSMGNNVHKQLESEFEFSDNKGDIGRLWRVGLKVAAVSDRQDYKYRFHIIDKEELNAFTTPGGHVYVHSGLMDKFSSDDELASVLAHEIGHCSAKHVVKKYQAALGYNLIASLALSQIDPESGARSTIQRSSSAIMNLVSSGYSRQDEYEADRLGIKYMFLAGYNPEAMIKTFEILLQDSKGGSAPTILRSHPHLGDRIIKAREEILKQATKN